MAGHSTAAAYGGPFATEAAQPAGSVLSAPEPASGARGDFETLLGQLRPELYRYALWLTRDAQAAEDAVQEALIRAWRSWRRLRDAQAAKPWLLTIVRRECARLYSRKRLETCDIDGLGGAEQAMIATCDDVETADIRDAILRLDAAYREPLVLQAIMGFSSDEIAAVVGIKRGAVLTRLFRARRRLTYALSETDAGARVRS